MRNAGFIRAITQNNSISSGTAKSVASIVFEGVKFTNQKFDMHEVKKRKSIKMFEIHPRYVQIQGIVMLGSRPLSMEALTPITKYENLGNINLDLKFYKD
jgi:hypothetical protein